MQKELKLMMKELIEQNQKSEKVKKGEASSHQARLFSR